MKIKLIFDSQFCGHDETIVFVEKLGENPVVYSITEKGKNIEIN